VGRGWGRFLRCRYVYTFGSGEKGGGVVFVVVVGRYVLLNCTQRYTQKAHSTVAVRRLA
jgi:hypothetical protein